MSFFFFFKLFTILSVTCRHGRSVVVAVSWLSLKKTLSVNRRVGSCLPVSCHRFLVFRSQITVVNV